MCGIFVCGVKEQVVNSASGESCEILSKKSQLLHLIQNRGPDGFSEFSLLPELDFWKVWFSASVLWMQGNEPAQQPLVDESCGVLLWNGDIFDGSMVSVNGKSDTEVLLHNFAKSSYSDVAFLKTLENVRGPYSFIYWDSRCKKLWFGRDRIGRHSLLWYFDSNNFMLSSVGVRGIQFLEVSTIGIFCMEFDEGSYKLVAYPWSDASPDSVLAAQALLPVPFLVSELTIMSPIVVMCPAPHEPPEEYFQIIKLASGDSEVQETLRELLTYPSISETVEELLNLLKQAVHRRSATHPGLCHDCIKTYLRDASKQTVSLDSSRKCSHPKVGVLFSGGLDSTILAALAHDTVPLDEPIDLFNVAFRCRKSKVEHKQAQVNTDEFCTPDRGTGLKSYAELKTLFPCRHWNFVEINVPDEELQNYRKTRIGDLIHPLNSVLDDSLGCALWFASRRSGVLDGSKYSSPSRVLLMGMGADEQFGGYTRHRNVLRHEGWCALASEIRLELSRISVRNLGRDDRVVADHGCQGRFPYLDEDVINYVSTVPVWIRCFPTSRLPPGLGDKILLRLAAKKLSLNKACAFPKRAFQFGSRIANSKEKATDVSPRLGTVL